MLQMHFKLFLLLMLLLAIINLIEGRGGGRRGGSFFSWRKSKKPSLSLSSSRRQSSGSHVSGSQGYKPLKPITRNKLQPYPTQQLPNGATYHASGSSLPPGAKYHGYFNRAILNGGVVPSGGIFYNSAADLPANAALYSQSQVSALSPGNLIFGMYAGHRLFGYHLPHHGRNDQGISKTDKIVIINNQTLESLAEISTVNATFSEDKGSTEISVIFQPSEDGLLWDALNSTNTNTTTEETSTEHGIICFPLLVNETKENYNGSFQQNEKIICYPAPPPEPDSRADLIPQSEAFSGIVCVHRNEAKRNSSDNPQNTVESNIDCYPVPPAPTWTEESPSTKSPDSVIGDIANEEERTAEQEDAPVTRISNQFIKLLEEKNTNQ